MTSTVKYLGGLRTEATHLASGQVIVTDAPVDNQGRGEAFSPTDLTATSLASCALTIMGISARSHGLNIDGATANVVKIMASDPRRIARIEVRITMPPNSFTDKDKKILEAAGRTCPVLFSLGEGVEKVLDFVWAD
jgi:putative redox protein